MIAKRNAKSHAPVRAMRAAAEWQSLVIDTSFEGTYQPTQKLNSGFAGGVFGK